MNTKTRTRTLVVTGLLVAIEAILVFLPVGFIRLPVVSATTMHLPVIVGAILEGPLVGGILGLVFGLLSFIYALIFPAEPLALIFQNPLVSVLPRILVGIGSAYVFMGFKKMATLENKNTAYRCVGATIYVLFSLALSWAAYHYVHLFAGLIQGIEPWLRITLSAVPAAAVIVLAVIFFKRFYIGDKRDIGAAVTGIAGALINTAGVLGMMALVEYKGMLIQIPDIAAKGLGVVLSSIILTNSIPEAILACAIAVLVFKALRPVYERRQANPVENKG